MSVEAIHFVLSPLKAAAGGRPPPTTLCPCQHIKVKLLSISSGVTAWLSASSHLGGDIRFSCGSSVTIYTVQDAFLCPVSCFQCPNMPAAKQQLRHSVIVTGGCGSHLFTL
eukprot:4934288-Amphidinium_carterae.1